ncbi:hypothetical protein SAMN02745245_01376 [Anaerosphaera aminiphila DSM 21120]|uniref:Uncharacterized protein n=1 Tax=Anaerosphaera aminiphila DSM 21120 TaxID=1120995 RepID=A0A1M5T754_9FIRM|nr:hypothetical protein [Anaerosphaera aminiphila]SHH46532.1 hypothetical protein SAMN02745245_01376 [Anaerosphaera aminiphila DSM 21120]
MSQTLGFIHHLMYGKITFLNSVTNSILEIAKRKKLNDLVYTVNEKGILEEGPLEEIVDELNIHGWIQKRVELVEEKFAAATSLLLSEKPEFKEEIFSLFNALGKSENFNGSPSDAYRLMISKFLDDMPCDHVLSAVDNENSVVFTIHEDVHAEYWNTYKNESLYWDLRSEYMKGVLSNTNYTLEKISENSYELK